MRFLAYFRSVATKLFYHSQVTGDMDEEFRSHLRHRADDLQRSGLSRAEAERCARIEFGPYQRYKQESHEALGGNFFETQLMDIRVSLRALRKSPGFTVTAVLTLAFAIGANAVMFSVMNAFILHPQYAPQAESLYGLQHGYHNGFQSYPDYLDLRDRNHSFDDLAAFNPAQAGLDTGKASSAVWLYETSGNYFDALRIRPYLGRVFHSSDEHGPDSASYIVLTYAYWHSHFQDDRAVIGRVVQLNKHPFTIIGVTPPEFHGTLLFLYPDFFVPIVNHEQVNPGYELNTRGNRWIFESVGHLKPGVTPAQAAADINTIAASLEKTYPKDDGNILTFTLVRPTLYGDYLGRPVRGFLAGLMLLAGLILLAACANLGSLFAARAADRSREIALRLALGSSRRRILRGVLTEALLISLLGGAVGLAGSIMLLRSLSAWQPFHLWPMIHVPVNPDATGYGVAVLLALLSGLLFGIAPVRLVLRTNPYEVVKSGSTTKVGRRITVRDLLLGAQIAICAVLVTSSMVALRGLVVSLYGNYGFDLRNTMVVDTNLSMAGYTGDKVPAMQKRMLDAVATIPGVESAGLADNVPLSGNSNESLVFADKTSDLRPANAAANALRYSISPEYFRAAGTTLLSGRTFTWHDDKDSPRVAVVNQEFARRVLGSTGNAVGGYYKMPDGTRVQVVGIAEDGKYQSLTETPWPVMFLPILQSPSSESAIVVRSSREPQQLAAAIRRTLHDLDAGLPVDVQTRSEGLEIILFGPRIATIALGIMGLMGAMLSITGIFGMAAYSVSRRLRELGIRIALGAQRIEVLEVALGHAVKLLAFGSAAGLVLGLLAAKVLARIVYQATPRDPLVLASVVLAMSFVGLLATWIPAQRALSINPLILLREE
jgi:predicted permease